MSKAHKDALNRRWADPKKRADMAVTMAKIWTPARRKQHAKRMRERWTDPAYRARLRVANKNAKIPKRRCKLCKQWYQPTSKCQQYCGKQKVKGTCSWKRGREVTKKFLAANPKLVSEYRKRHEERVRNDPHLLFKRRLNTLKKHLKKLGLTLEQYEKMSAAQSALCSICDKPNERRLIGKDFRLVVDHDHATNAVRGLLCDFCNVGLGLFKDSPERLRRAALYLEKHTATMKRNGAKANKQHFTKGAKEKKRNGAKGKRVRS